MAHLRVVGDSRHENVNALVNLFTAYSPDAQEFSVFRAATALMVISVEPE